MGFLNRFDKHMPSVSVIIPTHNRRALLLETLGSVFSQTYRDFEVLVVNDGSTDDTAVVLRPLVENGSIKYIEQPNSERAAARNRGLAVAQGEYIAFLDDDDLWPADKLEWQVAAMVEHAGRRVIYGAACPFRSDQKVPAVVTDSHLPVPKAGHPPSGDLYQSFLERNWIASPGQTLIPRRALLDVGCFDESLWGTEDYELYIRLAQRTEFHYVHRCALYYRVHATNSSRNPFRMHQNLCKVRRKHLGILPRSGTARCWIGNYLFWGRAVSGELVNQAEELTSAGARGRSLVLLARTARVSPPRLLRSGYWKAVAHACSPSAYGWLTRMLRRRDPGTRPSPA